MHTEKRWGWLGQGLVLVSLSLALAGCGGASGTGSTGAAPSSSVASSAPRVSGTPPATVAANNRYSFQPTLANPAGKPVSFSILNKPLWASFGLTTGELSGIPNAPQAGTYPNIIISASDGTSSSALPAFSIQVIAPASASSASGASVSASGTMIPSATQIVDSTHTVWTLASGVIYQDGKAAAYSANVALLLYFGGTLYQQNKSCLWWSWSGSAWVASSNPAPTLTPACSSAPASVTPPSSPTTPTGGFGIQVKGDQFVSAKDGSPLQLVGTNISGLETGSNSRWASFSNAGSPFWSKVLDWGGKGVNTVRLPLNEASWLNYTCYDNGAGASHSFYTAAGGGAYTPDPNNTYQASVKKAVADATAAGLYVILDLHWGSPNNAAGQPLCPIGQPSFADADHSLAFWKSIADTFKANPAVMFELFNEPFGDNVYSHWVSGATGAGPDAITLRDGGASYPFLEQNNTNGVVQSTALTWHVAGMQAMLDTIRGQGATNVVLSSPIGWAGEIETWLAAKPSDPIGQLGVAWHLYGYNKGQSSPLAVLAAGYPIVITETYGLGAIGGYSWAASHGIGYIWWGWNDWGGQPLSTQLNTAPWFQSTAP